MGCFTKSIVRLLTNRNEELSSKNKSIATKLPSWSSGAVCVTRLLLHNIFLYPAVPFLEQAPSDRLIKAPCLEDLKSEKLKGSFIIVEGVGFELNTNVRRLHSESSAWVKSHVIIMQQNTSILVWMLSYLCVIADVWIK